ncbi:MAG: lipoyl(octanoyl) transferase LipB [Neomegalonema sp.]|nr:lipoyl(octanoyl) transferase LipB [Neomegalonema sp.]
MKSKIHEDLTQAAKNSAQPVEWRVSDELVAYRAAEEEQERRAAAVFEHSKPELVWLLQHPPLYTAGVAADPSDLVEPDRFEVHHTRRGGQYTYHGPGQRVAYAVLDLNRRRRDVRAYVWALEEWVLRALARFGVHGERRRDRVGVWLPTGEIDALGAPIDVKIAAVGVRLRRWVAFHGVAINVDPDLSHFDGIVPCGVRRHGVTSLSALGVSAPMTALDAALHAEFAGVFDEFFLESAAASMDRSVLPE